MRPTPEFHIFRDTRHTVPVADLVDRLRTELRTFSTPPRVDDLLSVLLQAGELECGLEDGACAAASVAQQLTTLFADAAVRCDACDQPGVQNLRARALELLERLPCSGTLNVSQPEGFAYYALHPLDYADLIARLGITSPCVFVIGIRSIGTPLSAVVCAKLRQLGTVAERTTVRPGGYPYERYSRFDDAQRQQIARALASGAEFLVCDEGPGRSGSSLLSVAEALEREGVPTERLRMLCSHDPDTATLCAPDAARRWRRYPSFATGMTRRLPPGATNYVGGGEWRQRIIGTRRSWPAVWPQMERLKYLSADGQQIFTFEGYGACGAAVRARNEALSASGFGARYLGQESGFGAHLLPPGRPASRDDLTPALLARIAEYCAWRARAFRVNASCDEVTAMVRTNFVREFGEPLHDVQLEMISPAVCDNRMAPPYWWIAADGRPIKLDAAIHGDDHFFPGPCDIAWDLAGAIVEWRLSSSARDFLVARYCHASGDDLTSRLPSYELAYATFRMAWSGMAASSVADAEEERRLSSDYRYYWSVVAGYSRRQMTPKSDAPMTENCVSLL